MNNDIIICPIESTLKVLNRKWTIVLIRDMFNGKKYFHEFNENKKELSNTVLSDTLKNMEKNELIIKKDNEYHLTSRGIKLNKILYEMAILV